MVMARPTKVVVTVGFVLGSALGDFDRMVAAKCWDSLRTSAIYYLKPNAAGVLGAPQIINLGSAQGNAVAADFDNDGWLDLMVAAGNAVWLRNNQAGSFAAPLGTSVPAGFIASGDWDQDGLVDIVGTDGVRTHWWAGTVERKLTMSASPTGYEKGRNGTDV